MSRIHLILLAICLCAMSVGCRSRCNNGCNGGGWFANNTRVAPPPTYSLNIPSVAQNQPYYTPGAVNPNSNAPTPANSPTGQTGWRPPSNDGASTNGNPNGGGQSVLTQPTTFVETNPATGQPYPRSASAANLPGSGFSYTSSPNYQTTRVDERFDSTRLPVTDASAVRAPAAAGAMMAQQRPATYPAGYTAPSGYNSYAPTQQTYVAQNGYSQPVNPFYNGTAVLVGGQPRSPVSYQGQAVLMNPNGYPSSSPSIVAQSTATIDSNAGVWRNREMNSERF